MTDNTEELREKLRNLFFKSAGGVSDMANEEVEEAMQLITTHTAKQKKKWEKEAPKHIIDARIWAIEDFRAYYRDIATTENPFVAMSHFIGKLKAEKEKL